LKNPYLRKRKKKFRMIVSGTAVRRRLFWGANISKSYGGERGLNEGEEKLPRILKGVNSCTE